MTLDPDLPKFLFASFVICLATAAAMLLLSFVV